MAEPQAVQSAEVTHIPGETPRAAPETTRTTTAQEAKNGYHYQDSARSPQDTTRREYNYQESARATQRSAVSRATLQPSVHDFNGNIIKKALDDDQVVWLIGKNHAKIHPAATEYSYPVPASFRGSGAFGALQWESARLPNVTGPLGVPSHRADRTAAWAEEVHRRHLARTARARARLSPKQRMMERVIPSGPGMIYDHHHQQQQQQHNHHHHHHPQHPQDSSFSLSLPANEENLEDVRLTSLSRMSSRNDNFHTARSRPATTGRYFDTSNGLRNLRSNGPAGLRSRPTTASQFSGPGLSIRRVTLHQKELMT